MTAKEEQYFDLAAEDEVLNPIGAELTAEEDGAALAQQGLLKTTKTERSAWCTQQGADNIWQHQWTGEQLDNGLIRKSTSPKQGLRKPKSWYWSFVWKNSTWITKMSNSIF
jgi:hypothetical protein